MGRGKAPMTPAQQRALDEATRFNDRWREFKVMAFAEARRKAEEEIAAMTLERDRLVRAAIDAGVPKARFREKEGGLRTSSPNDVDIILARTESVASVVEEVQEAGRPSWIAKPEGNR